MTAEEKIKALEDEFQPTREELKQIMLDIRAVIMEATSPLRWESGADQQSAPTNSAKGMR
jgi:hypothetical protein